MDMPVPDATVMARRGAIAAAMRAIVPGEGVIDRDDALAVYESDALTAYCQRPLLVVLPETVDQVAAVLGWCHAQGVKVVPRGAGTSLSGGALPLADGIVLGLSKFGRILEIDYSNRVVVAQPGVTNAAISQAVAGRGFYYAPDPSSQIACTIGGNVAENAGGVHCLKYGLTTHNVLGLEIVLMTGERVRLGGKACEQDGLDLVGLMVGSEGLLGIVTEVTLRILPRPAMARAMLIGFAHIAGAADCVAAIIGAGIIPAAIELMDRGAIHAAEAFAHCGYPLDVAALLIVEVDGPPDECGELLTAVTAIATAHDAISQRIAADETERLLFWKGRKSAFPAVGQISPDYYCMDGTIPRRALADVLDRMAVMAADCGLRIVNVFHAGDGNLHPMILYDANIAGEMAQAEVLGADILRLCVAVGGVLTGEHGVGVEKRDLMGTMFSDVDLAQQERIKHALDPGLLLNPGKMFPALHRCAELGQVHIHGGTLRFPELPRL